MNLKVLFTGNLVIMAKMRLSEVGQQKGKKH